jgi:hypothetical protein
MAAAEDRWGEQRCALNLLDNVEQIVGALPTRYESVRSRCRVIRR